MYSASLMKRGIQKPHSPYSFKFINFFQTTGSARKTVIEAGYADLIFDGDKGCGQTILCVV